MNRLFRGLLLVTTITIGAFATGCASDTSDDAAASEDDLRSIATSFYERTPLTGTRMEKMRRALEGDDNGMFLRNYHLSGAIHWESSVRTPTDTDRANLVQAAFTFWQRQNDPASPNKKYARGLAPVAATSSDLAAALDSIGLTTVNSDDATSTAARAELDAALVQLAGTNGVHVFVATLPKGDMYWYKLLAVVDEENHEILLETGGYGN